MPSDSPERFIVITKNGWSYHDPQMCRDMFMPFCTEFDATRIDDSFVLFNSKILPTACNGQISIIEKACLDDMLWKVVAPQHPIDFFKDALRTEYVYTFYSNSEVIVDRSSNDLDGKLYKVWNQELYFHISNKDHLQPMKRFILARVCNTDGLLLRPGKEIYSAPILGLLPYNTIVVIKNKAFTDIPSNQNIKRLEIFHNTSPGWINAVSSFDGKDNVDILGLTDNPFDHMSKTTIIKFDASPFQDLSVNPTMCVVCLTREKTVAAIHEGLGHLVFCSTCAPIMDQRKEKCPICRSPVLQYLRMY